MLTFRSLTEIQKARLPPRIIEALTGVMKDLLLSFGDAYSPEDDGYIVLITPHTTEADALQLMGTSWSEARLEGVTCDPVSRCFITCILFNNQFGISIVVPDEPWLDSRFRAKLQAEMQ